MNGLLDIYIRPSIQGNYGPNMNGFWQEATEKYTTCEILTKIFDFLKLS